jgi:hypothetical protein
LSASAITEHKSAPPCVGSTLKEKNRHGLAKSAVGIIVTILTTYRESKELSKKEGEDD